jgi:hypothetical protein
MLLINQLRDAGAPDDPDPSTLQPLADSYYETKDRTQRDQLIMLLALPAYRIARRWAHRLRSSSPDDAVGEGLLALVQFVDGCDCGDIRRRALAHVSHVVKDYIKGEKILSCPPRQARRLVCEGKPVPTMRRREWTALRKCEQRTPLREAFRLWEALGPDDCRLVEMKLAGCGVPEIAAAMGWKPWRVYTRLRELTNCVPNSQKQEVSCPLLHVGDTQLHRRTANGRTDETVPTDQFARRASAPGKAWNLGGVPYRQAVGA